jgi:hypothetical protein
MQKQTFTLTILTLFISCGFAFSAPDTPETRRHEAERYLQATAESTVRGHGRASAAGPTRSIQEAHDFATRHRGINQSDDRRDGEAFHHRGVEGIGRFLWLTCREIRDAKVRRLHGGHHADDGSRDNESAGKAEPINAQSITEIT